MQLTVIISAVYISFLQKSGTDYFREARLAETHVVQFWQLHFNASGVFLTLILLFCDDRKSR